MRKVFLFLIGLTPFVLGRIMNDFMMVYPDTPLPYTGIGIAFLLLWFCITFLLGTRSWKETVFLLNLPALTVLILLFIQEIILGAYWRNAIGIYTQLFYLPLLNLGSLLTSWGHRVILAQAADFLLLTLSAYLGCLLRRRFRK